ncbi:MAG: GGDEF domain-containing protein, partial [Gammaproteobacteria bacterium]|nr:GGDEF domain-containing protein [Gammaproteobacteria bacterium]
LGVAIIALIVLSPFAINNFIQGRFLLGLGSSAVVVLCAVSAWQSARNRYQPSLILWGLVPAMTLFLVLALRQQGMVVTYWAFPVILAIYFMLPKRQAWIANFIFLAFILPQAWMILDFPLVVRFIFTILAVSALSAMFVQLITDQQNTLEQHVITDPLTGLHNRLLLNETLEQTIHQNNRTSTPMTLIEFDIDHFKVINDTLGHAEGDKVLRGIGEFFKTRVRRADKVFRVGGEEFLVLLYDTDAEDGKRLATELCSAIASLELLPYSKVTVSAGVATLKAGEHWEEWMKRCDENLYQAKKDGRNQVAA